MGVHRGWYLRYQYEADALVIGIFVIAPKDAIHLIDYCPSCHRWWKSLLSPCGRERHFLEPGRGPVPTPAQILEEDDEGLRGRT